MRPFLLPLLLLAGCGAIPRDPDGTLDTIRESGVIRVGEIAGAEEGDVAAARKVLRRLSVRTGATPTTVRGTLEPLLLGLEARQLDLVIAGRFDEKSPWAARVTLGPPIHRRLEASGIVTASYVVARNGENGWITLVQRETKAEVGAQ